MCSSGIAAISGARTPSQISIVRRAPSRVASPPANPPSATAAASTASTTVMRVAEPDVVSTNHGSATQVICEPVSETTSRARIPISPRLRKRSRLLTPVAGSGSGSICWSVGLKTPVSVTAR